MTTCFSFDTDYRRTTKYNSFRESTRSSKARGLDQLEFVPDFPECGSYFFVS